MAFLHEPRELRWSVVEATRMGEAVRFART
jgi:hypothetical protein